MPPFHGRAALCVAAFVVEGGARVVLKKIYKKAAM